MLRDLHALKRPLAIRFTKKNAVHPFEDATSFEFFSAKNDASLLVFGSHSKKRPHALTFVRTFDAKVLDMVELLVDPDTLRSLSQFKLERKAAVGLKPLVCFAGAKFDSPTATPYTLARSVLLDLLKGPDVGSVDVEGLQYMVCVSAGEEDDARIKIRYYMLRTKRSGTRLPTVEVEEMGPRIDFKLGRVQHADDTMMKEAMRRPRGIEVSHSLLLLMMRRLLIHVTQPRAKKNISTDLIGDKVGRIHLGKQSLNNLQTRKMKGLKRGRDGGGVNGDDETVVGEDDAVDTKRSRV